MAFTQFTRTRTKETVFHDSVRVSESCLYFSRQFWEKELGGAKRLAVYFDEDRGLVGIKPTEDRLGFKVTKHSTNVMKIYWRTFTKAMSLSFERSVDRRVGRENSLLVFSIREDRP